MNVRDTVAHWAIEGVGGALVLASLWFVARSDETLLLETLHFALPLVLGAGVVLFGRWLDRGTVLSADSRERALIAAGHVAGGVTLGLVTGWVLVVVNVGNRLPAEVAHILLNGIGIGILGGGIFAGVYLRLRNQQATLRARSAELERQNARLEKLATTVSHDLRNPLAVARSRLELARETGEAEHFDAIDRSLDRIDRLVEEILVLSRHSESRIEPTPAALEPVATAAWGTVSTRGVTLDVEGSTTVDADESRLRQLFENLFRNAIEHGGESVTTVRVGPLDAAGFYVEDDGAGIPAARRERVREWGETTDPDGTGLGLAIVSEIVETHGWHMRITEGADGGARFEFAVGDGAA